MNWHFRDHQEMSQIQIGIGLIQFAQVLETIEKGAIPDPDLSESVACVCKFLAWTTFITMRGVTTTNPTTD